MLCFRICISVLFLFPLFVLGQNHKDDLRTIDNLLIKADQAYQKFEDIKCLEYAKEAGKLATKIADPERQYKSYYFMARVLATLQLQKESMLYVEKMEALGYAKNNKILNAELKEIKSHNYRLLGLASQSFIEDNSIINLLKGNSSTKSLMIQARAYTNIGSYYYALGKTDSSFVYIRREENILKKIPENQAVFKITELYDAKGYTFLKLKELDSAFYYFNKGYALKKKYKDPLLYIQYCAFADYYMEKGEKQKALDYYLKTIENIEKYNALLPDYLIVYKAISEIYGASKQYDKETVYLKKYTHIIDSISELKEKKIDFITNVILKEKEQKYKLNNATKIWIITLISLISLLVLYFTYKKYKKAKRMSLLNEHRILEKENETQHLKSKLNDSFNELITLAKTNHSGFYARFQEVYPEFQKKLLQINQELQIPELTLSAYIYLDFQTKEIADFSFKSFRTIQNRKNRLRKKLNLSSSENLNVWFKNLMITSEHQ